MNAAFLLRYQETCEPDDSQGISSGTMTETRILAEQADADYAGDNYYVLARRGIAAATPTKTAVGGEAPDHTAACGMTVLPRMSSASAPTMTLTFAHAEAAHSDFGQRGMDVIPKCS